MNIGSFSSTVAMFARLVDTKTSTTPIINCIPDKPEAKYVDIVQPFPRTLPETENISSQRVQAFLEALNKDKSLNMHNVMILRNGRVICEADFGEQDIRIWKNVFSAAKSITSLAIGMLLEDGTISLQDKVVSFFDEYATPMIKIKWKDLKVEHLLTMTSACSFNEVESVTQENWVKGFLNAVLLGEVGKTFNYNSLNTYMLSAILQKVTGKNMADFLKERLFEPLGIYDYYIENCPMGIAKGGWGIYLHVEDMAKIGQLVLQDGVWNRKRIVSGKYLRRAISVHKEVPDAYGRFHYGYQIWVGKDSNTFLFNGMFGQNVLGFRDSKILLVTNAGNNELFQQSSFYEMALQFWNDPFTEKVEENFSQQRRLQEYCDHLQKGVIMRPMVRFWNQMMGKGDLPRECERIYGKRWEVISHKDNALGLMPLILQAVQNNYSSGLKAISFEQMDHKLMMHYYEKDEEHCFTIGFGEVCVSTLMFRKQPYLVGVTGRFTTDEDDYPVLKIQLAFLETSFTRMLKVYFDEDEIYLQHEEQPGQECMVQWIQLITDDLSRNKIIGSALAKVDADYLYYRINKMFSPVMQLYPMEAAWKKDKKEVTKEIEKK